MSRHYADTLLKWRYLFLVLMLGCAAVAFYGGQFLGFSTDYRVFFSKENPQLQAFEELQNTYTKNDNVLFVLAPKDGNVFQRDVLAAVEWLTEESWQIPHSIRVDSISNFQNTYAAGEDDLIVEDLIYQAETLSADDIASIKQVALGEPLLVNRLISPRAHVTGINVTIQLPGVNEAIEVPETVAFSRELAASFSEQFPDIDIYITGMVFMNNAFSEQSFKDMTTLVPLMFGVIFIVLALLLRSVTATLTTFVVIILSIVTAMGITGWLGIRLTPPAASAPTIIATLAVADCVHILVNFIHSMQKGMSKRDAMHESLRINLQPIFLTSITTAIGFMSMNFSDAPPFRDLGNIVAMGVMAAFVYSVTVLPALVMLLPVKVKLRQDGDVHLMDHFADFVVKHRNTLLITVGVVVFALVSQVPRNELNDEFVKYFEPSVDFRAHTDFATENLTGIYTIEYSLPSGESNGISDPGYLRDVAALSEWFRAQPAVLHVNTITDIMQRLNMNMHGDDKDWYRLPDNRELAAQYLLLYEMSLPYGLDLNNQLNVGKSATRLTVTLDSLSSNNLLKLERQAKEWMQNNTPNIVVDGASPSIMFAHIGKRNIESMLVGATVALILISGILIFALRSLKMGLISLLPNLIPAAMGFGLWALLVGRVGLALSVVASMTLGIVVDDTVHFISKYLRARREQGADAATAVRYAFHTVGTALWVTTLVLSAGFIVLAQSVFELNSSMGLLTAITILFALFADFFLLPSLLMAIDKKPMHRA